MSYLKKFWIKDESDIYLIKETILSKWMQKKDFP